jgi:hypothetical protein
MGPGRSGAPVGLSSVVRIEGAHCGWWATGLRHARALHHHAHAPADHAVKESIACDRQVVPDASRAGATWADRTERLPERLSYSRYLERSNTERAAPGSRRGEPGAPDGADRGWAALGDVPAARERTAVERRVETAYRVRIISPAGRYLDMWV